MWRWDGKAFGETLAGGSVIVNLRFPGQYYDEETQLHYNWNRYYDPRVGRYITSDPIGLYGGMNTFGYVGGNPLAFIDDSGNIRLPSGTSKLSGFLLEALLEIVKYRAGASGKRIKERKKEIKDANDQINIRQKNKKDAQDRKDRRDEKCLDDADESDCFPVDECLGSSFIQYLKDLNKETRGENIERKTLGLPPVIIIPIPGKI